MTLPTLYASILQKPKDPDKIPYTLAHTPETCYTFTVLQRFRARRPFPYLNECRMHYIPVDRAGTASDG
ncbi:hypothetical protein BABINDRAFT_158820 [Babjeviella inositovora NRRL Y-12698]|uniref:Uncharacterized protein n=1 Tax=Babjeviella inositovora NRRL Y-12698 TaxID=984486 RepID=A0A1E3QX51_9ASCO|nr:uncharacterized protein BABINDRAFT_158820 [Babjeviella inositovora NRRL Y-12698]ODQ82171.1 hypothetical protein BABINDRAFT_158820 [Babjeviella inositovora NRRL Y-12698]